MRNVTTTSFSLSKVDASRATAVTIPSLAPTVPALVVGTAHVLAAPPAGAPPHCGLQEEGDSSPPRLYSPAGPSPPAVFGGSRSAPEHSARSRLAAGLRPAPKHPPWPGSLPGPSSADQR